MAKHETRLPDPSDPDLDFCSRCHEHTDFKWDEDEEGWVSVCCTAKPVELP